MNLLMKDQGNFLSPRILFLKLKIHNIRQSFAIIKLKLILKANYANLIGRNRR